jgi:hypothetical protein
MEIILVMSSPRGAWAMMTIGEQAQCDEPFLSIVERARSGQHLFGTRKILAMFSGVAAVLRLVPFVYRAI